MLLPLALLIAVTASQQRTLVPGGDDDGTQAIAAEPRCDPAAQDEICIKANPNRYRLERIEPRYVQPRARAAQALGPGEISIEAEQRELPGATAPAAMVRFRMPFGRKKPK
ncbi:hypothetical protein E5A73_11925 [Sphingomonas gei]|uniref:Uncharacterized protein n=1 Tax=Sphingomonas gei TaxID=1395960 RepID=A0A4S1XCI2_9SPHN|nr:hypothetical protein [Sphingomonas gei]TGX53535.1 hypothetical protein E5A73_11925 [Sphingomonas gei]